MHSSRNKETNLSISTNNGDLVASETYTRVQAKK